MKALHPVSPILISAIFVVSGVLQLLRLAGTGEFVGQPGFPMPTLFTVLAILFELGGGLGLLIGFKTRWSAAALIIFLIIATLSVHVPMMKDPKQAQGQQIHIMKNVAILGGLLKFLLDGA